MVIIINYVYDLVRFLSYFSQLTDLQSYNFTILSITSETITFIDKNYIDIKTINLIYHKAYRNFENQSWKNPDTSWKNLM